MIDRFALALFLSILACLILWNIAVEVGNILFGDDYLKL